MKPKLHKQLGDHGLPEYEFSVGDRVYLAGRHVGMANGRHLFWLLYRLDDDGDWKTDGMIFFSRAEAISSATGEAA